MKNHIILLFALLTHFIESQIDIEKLCALPIELQQKIIKTSGIDTCFSLENNEYENIFKFLSIDYYLKDPDLWTQKDADSRASFYPHEQNIIKKNHSYRTIKYLASWLDAAFHCFFYHGAMDLIVASECRKIRNGNSRITNFSSSNYFKQLSCTEHQVYKTFNDSQKRLFQETFEERLKLYIPHIQPIPIPLSLKPTKPATINYETIENNTITFEPFFYDWRDSGDSLKITDYHFGLKEKNEENNHYLKLTCNNYPHWFFIRQNLNFLQTAFIINQDNKTITADNRTIEFLDTQQLTTQQILFLQKMHYYIAHTTNISFNRGYSRVKLSLSTILRYPIAQVFTPQYQLSEEWTALTSNNKTLQKRGLDIIDQAVHIPTWLEIMQYKKKHINWYYELTKSTLIIYSLYILKKLIQYKTCAKKNIPITIILFIAVFFLGATENGIYGYGEYGLPLPTKLNFAIVQNKKTILHKKL